MNLVQMYWKVSLSYLRSLNRWDFLSISYFSSSLATHMHHFRTYYIWKQLLDDTHTSILMRYIIYIIDTFFLICKKVNCCLPLIPIQFIWDFCKTLYNIWLTGEDKTALPGSVLKCNRVRQWDIPAVGKNGYADSSPCHTVLPFHSKMYILCSISFSIPYRIQCPGYFHFCNSSLFIKNY